MNVLGGAVRFGPDLLSLDDLDESQILALLDFAGRLKAGRQVASLQGKVLGLVFLKASTRTRVSFSVAMYQLGGQVIDLSPNTTQVGRGEPVRDTARVLSRYVDGLAIRTFAQAELEEYARYADIPVINALTDYEHPCQVLADLLTIEEHLGTFAALKLAYIGDGNNVAHSLLLGCVKVGLSVAIAAPDGYTPERAVVERARAIAARTGATVEILADPAQAVRGAHVLYTDVWTSMGQEEEARRRRALFAPYQIDDRLLRLAHPKAIVLHCLPAHRGEEITEQVIEGPHARIWDQAENRLHAQKAVLAALL
ncbi:ornithine carbamoyltransferase [Gloeobacter kilaueensis]|uniref:Ornithine carbamoyltransferase n=1 Tax=Gloeobacter kilaueensis (strain ATCC BAA-2537 / CCAP 1431/1 / ULC 316 / JS1) TaxID=1183438 RepID=U5QIT6_GLOK1|nr:ornithine carbamoyltransferase [Gloeobacter kilaueensis]AGY58811.1 ornithine carbamoyltransferase [Gloeobacter kilaueensis JS1]